VTPLFGHDDAVATFRDAITSNRLHHAWLISGPEGIGKALFAQKAALRLLADAAGPPVEADGLDVSDDHPIAHLLKAGSHTDFIRLVRLPRDEDSPELRRNITVDQVRQLQPLLGTTPFLSPWRAIIIDSVDDLEPSAANALLKNLEEPPPRTLFLLVSHASQRLLPTVRSRCRLLRLAPLDRDAMASAIAAALPDADANEIKELAALGEGSPGRALGLRGLEIEALDRQLEEILKSGDRNNARRSALAQNFTSKASQPRFEAFLDRVPSLIARAAKERRGPALAEALGLWKRAHDLAGSAVRLSLDQQSVVFELAGMLAALAPRQANG